MLRGQKLSWVALKCPGKVEDVVYRDVPMTTLNRADISAIEASAKAKFLLRDPNGQAKPAEIMAKQNSRIGVPTPGSHAGEPRNLMTLRLRTIRHIWNLPLGQLRAAKRCS